MLGNDVGIERLARVLKPASGLEEAEAAVALLLKSVDQALEILVVKRVEKADDPWSGQMAFPGGKRDAEDEDLRQTVIRETLEETNINLLSHCRSIGIMDTFRSTTRPEMRVLPFVFLLEHEPKIRLNEELETFLWIPLQELVQHKGTARFSFGEVPAYIVRNSLIWGLTYRILEKFVYTLDYSH